MQISQHVHVRGVCWQVTGVRAYEDCALVTLSGVGAASSSSLRVLTPFDCVEPIARVVRREPRFVRMTRWRRACRALLADDLPPGSLRSPASARIDLLPHQLEPALAVVRGAGCRFLLADDVGLGKTIQAGLIVAELRARGLIERVLILTPAGLRDQWARELADRFDVQAEILDARMLRRRAADLPIGMNPWTTIPIAIASIDYVKRPEVRPAVEASHWDLLVVDEAHGVVGESDRHSAVQSIAARAPFALLLTATPHSGDRRAFVSLCDLGAVGADRLVVFRHTREAIRGGATRRIHTLFARRTDAELRVHEVLNRYTAAVRAEHGDERSLALSVLHKRAYSSAWSLAESVDRRLRMLSSPLWDRGDEQLALPLGDPAGELTDEDDSPAWPVHLSLADRDRERRMLSALAEAAREAASAGESKINALARLLRRVRESAVVFTEYRDTLLHLRGALVHRVTRPTILLHGGLTRDERAAAIETFSSRIDALLLSTDAGCEGLNLHRRCRLVISLELPWNPMRLEQRIGRVDRIGQQRPVHAFHFVGAQTGEMKILERLKQRIARARADVAAPDPIGGDEERAMAKIALGCAGSVDSEELPDQAPPGMSQRVSPDLRDDGEQEATRLAAVRTYGDAQRDLERASREADGPLVTRARRRRLRCSLGRRTLLVYRVSCEDEAGHAIATRLVPLSIAGSLTIRSVVCRADPIGSGVVAQDFSPAFAIGYVERAAAEWRRAAVDISQQFWETRLTRERAIADAALSAASDLYQPGLFDCRAERARRDGADSRSDRLRASTARIAALERSAATTIRPPELVLILLP